MAFTVSWITPRRYRSPLNIHIVVKLLVTMISLSSLSSTVAVRAVSIKCGACEEARCPELHYCEGEPVKDHCGCCTVCSSSRFQPHPLIMGSSEREGSACAQVKCPKFKVCMENVQSLPLCTCPSAFICRTRKRERPVCGTDGTTYKSRCYLRIAACNAGARIKVARKGPCNGDAEAALPDGSRPPRVCESFSTCRRRKNQRPVCGSDDKTYMSRCQMKIQACQLGLKIRLKNRGVCHTPSPHNTHTNARGSHNGGGGGNTHNSRPHGGGGNTRPHHNPRPRPPGARINTHRVSDRSDGVMNSGGGGGSNGMNRLTRNDGTHQGGDGESEGLRGRGGKGRRGKKKGGGSGSDVDNMDEEKRKRRQRKREKRLKRKERRRKRRKTRGKSRSRRNKIDRRKQRLPRRTFDDNMHWDF